jgi:AraC-like DNA-binding protein
MEVNRDLHDRVRAAGFAETLFDRIPDVVFFVKDREGRYVMVNQTLVDRCGLASKEEILGRTTRELFPDPLGKRFLDQDFQVLRGGGEISDLLELHLFPSRVEGWCLTDKVPLTGSGGAVVGLAGVSRDLALPNSPGDLHDLAAVVRHIQTRYHEPLRVETLAEKAGLSTYQLNRRIRAIFSITAGQLIAKTRIDAASHLLRTTAKPVGEVAAECGYFDQSAFTRQFKSLVGLTPRQYREHHAGPARPS